MIEAIRQSPLFDDKAPLPAVLDMERTRQQKGFSLNSSAMRWSNHLRARRSRVLVVPPGVYGSAQQEINMTGGSRPGAILPIDDFLKHQEVRLDEKSPFLHLLGPNDWFRLTTEPIF